MALHHFDVAKIIRIHLPILWVLRSFQTYEDMKLITNAKVRKFSFSHISLSRTVCHQLSMKKTYVKLISEIYFKILSFVCGNYFCICIYMCSLFKWIDSTVSSFPLHKVFTAATVWFIPEFSVTQALKNKSAKCAAVRWKNQLLMFAAHSNS